MCSPFVLFWAGRGIVRAGSTGDHRPRRRRGQELLGVCTDVFTFGVRSGQARTLTDTFGHQAAAARVFKIKDLGGGMNFACSN
jgi:hypothetical protein